MELQLVSKQTAIMAKELGFNEDCWRILLKDDTQWRLLYYENDGFCKNSDIVSNSGYFSNPIEEILCTIPEQELLAKWLRETKGIYIHVEMGTINKGEDLVIAYEYKVKEILDYKPTIQFIDDEYETYEKAMEAALSQGLSLIKVATLKKNP